MCTWLVLASSLVAGPATSQVSAPPAPHPRVLLLPPVADQPPAVIEQKRIVASSAPPPDMVLRWNDVALWAVRADRTPPPLAARNLAIVHGAVYEAVNAVTRTHSHFLVDVRPGPGVSAEAAAAAAAHQALAALYPRLRARFDEALRACLTEVPDGHARCGGIELGRFIADKFLEWRCPDTAVAEGAKTMAGHFSEAAPPGRTPAAGSAPEKGPDTLFARVGVWRPTPPGYRPALLPGWVKVSPFALRAGSLPRPPGPPPLHGAAYAAAFREVKDLGSRFSTVRTPDQTTIAHFWADGDGTSTPPGHWNRIAQDVARARKTSLAQSARLFALLNLSLADAGLACWIIKFDDDFWRPITAIRQADRDGNPDTVPDPDWEPLLPTPPFPSYTSGHSTFSGAAAAALRNFFGTDQVTFETTSEGAPGVRRSFTSFSAAAAEAGRSRIYGGIHYEFDNSDALATGRAVGDFIARYYLLPQQAPVHHEAARVFITP